MDDSDEDEGGVDFGAMDEDEDLGDIEGRMFAGGHHGAQSYFKAHKGNGRTSSRNLSGIQLPGHSEVVSMLKGQPKNPIVDQLAAYHAKVNAITLPLYNCTHLAHVAQNFALWRCQLYAGFNLVFYGFGSKKSLAEVGQRETHTQTIPARI